MSVAATPAPCNMLQEADVDHFRAVVAVDVLVPIESRNREMYNF